VTGGPLAGVPGVVGRHLMLGLQAVSREVRTLVGDTSGQVHASFIAAGHAHAVEHHEHERHPEHLDDSAGGEFVDDRIRELD
jgi:hypothetical protein